MLFVVIVVTAVIVAIRADAWWTTALAVAGVAAGACGVVLVAFALLADEDDAEPETGPSRSGNIALGTVAVILLVLALVVPESAKTDANTSATARSADETLRQFLLSAIVEDDAYPSCQYLTTGQQAALARQAGATSCRLALTGTSPSLDGVQNEGDIDRLKIRVTVVGSRATAVVSGRDRPAVTFTLARATPAEVEAFEAPSTPWRIASGAEALVA
jgi:hypothetical protein